MALLTDDEKRRYGRPGLLPPAGMAGGYSAPSRNDSLELARRYGGASAASQTARQLGRPTPMEGEAGGGLAAVDATPIASRYGAPAPVPEPGSRDFVGLSTASTPSWFQIAQRNATGRLSRGQTGGAPAESTGRYYTREDMRGSGNPELRRAGRRFSAVPTNDFHPYTP